MIFLCACKVHKIVGNFGKRSIAFPSDKGRRNATVYLKKLRLEQVEVLMI